MRKMKERDGENQRGKGMAAMQYLKGLANLVILQDGLAGQVGLAEAERERRARHVTLNGEMQPRAHVLRRPPSGEARQQAILANPAHHRPRPGLVPHHRLRPHIATTIGQLRRGRLVIAFHDARQNLKLQIRQRLQPPHPLVAVDVWARVAQDARDHPEHELQAMERGPHEDLVAPRRGGLGAPEARELREVEVKLVRLHLLGRRLHERLDVAVGERDGDRRPREDRAAVATEAQGAEVHAGTIVHGQSGESLRATVSRGDARVDSKIAME